MAIKKDVKGDFLPSLISLDFLSVLYMLFQDSRCNFFKQFFELL